MSDKLNTPVITRTLSQLQGVEDVLVHPVGKGSSSFTVLVWTENTSISTNITTSQHLDELVDIVECHVTDSLVSKKRSLNYRITH